MQTQAVIQLQTPQHIQDQSQPPLPDFICHSRGLKLTRRLTVSPCLEAQLS